MQAYALIEALDPDLQRLTDAYEQTDAWGIDAHAAMSTFLVQLRIVKMQLDAYGGDPAAMFASWQYDLALAITDACQQLAGFTPAQRALQSERVTTATARLHALITIQHHVDCAIHSAPDAAV